MKNVEFYHCRNARDDSHNCRYVLCGSCHGSLSDGKRRSRMVDQNAAVHQIINGCSHKDRDTFHRANYACYILNEMMNGCCGECKGDMKELMYGRVWCGLARSGERVGWLLAGWG
jgi:hypothetical protein